MGHVVRAACAALAPARLAWGAMAIVVLIVAGRAADAVYLALGGPPIGPSGLVAGTWSAEQQEVARRQAASSVAALALGTSWSAVLAEAPTKDDATLRSALDGAYIEKVSNAGAPARQSLESRYRQTRAALHALRPRGPAEAFGSDLVAGLRGMGLAVVQLSPVALLDASMHVFVRTPRALVRASPWFAVLAGIPLAALTAVLLGGLARMSVTDAGRGVKSSLASTARFVRLSLGRLALVPTLPIATALLLALFMMLVGVLLRVPALNMLGGLLYGVVLFASVIVVVAFVGFVVGWPMAIAAVATGDSDAVDATVRVTSYMLRRPGTTVLVLAAAIVGIAVGLTVAGGIATLAFTCAETMVGLGAGASAGTALGDHGILAPASSALPTAERTTRVTNAFIDLWELVVVLLLGGAAISLIMDAAGRGYLLLRCACDGQDPSVVTDLG